MWIQIFEKFSQRNTLMIHPFDPSTVTSALPSTFLPLEITLLFQRHLNPLKPFQLLVADPAVSRPLWPLRATPAVWKSFQPPVALAVWSVPMLFITPKFPTRRRSCGYSIFDYSGAKIQIFGAKQIIDKNFVFRVFFVCDQHKDRSKCMFDFRKELFTTFWAKETKFWDIFIWGTLTLKKAQFAVSTSNDEHWAFAGLLACYVSQIFEERSQRTWVAFKELPFGTQQAKVPSGDSDATHLNGVAGSATTPFLSSCSMGQT